MCRYETTMSVYIPYINSLQLIPWPETLVYLPFHIIGTCLWMNMSDTLCLYVIQYCYCNIHIYIYIKQNHTYQLKSNKIQLQFTLPLSDMYQQQICLSNARYMPHSQITGHIHGRSMPIRNFFSDSEFRLRLCDGDKSIQRHIPKY